MTDDTKYRDIFSVTAINLSTQLFAIDRDFKLWSMYSKMPPPTWEWTEWAAFTMPGDSGGVTKIYGSPGTVSDQRPIGIFYYFPRLWAIDLKNNLWSCASKKNQSGMSDIWSSWAEWIPPYPGS
jgi:hypothetical protein